MILASGPDGDFNVLAQSHEELDKVSVRSKSLGCTA
jgi:hypothetical protein